MKRPDADALYLAAEWAEAYNPGAEDAVELSAVAAWLREQARASESAALKRTIAKSERCRLKAQRLLDGVRS